MEGNFNEAHKDRLRRIINIKIQEEFERQRKKRQWIIGIIAVICIISVIGVVTIKSDYIFQHTDSQTIPLLEQNDCNPRIKDNESYTYSEYNPHKEGCTYNKIMDLCRKAGYPHFADYRGYPYICCKIDEQGMEKCITL